MSTKKKKLDLPQAIVLAVVVGSLLIAAGMVLTWGPEDSRAQVAEWIGMGVAGLGLLFSALRAKGLFTSTDDEGGES